MISYELSGKTKHIDVRQPGPSGKRTRVIGQIKKVKDGTGYFYQPKGSNAKGETFATVAEVKRSLEE